MIKKPQVMFIGRIIVLVKSENVYSMYKAKKQIFQSTIIRLLRFSSRVFIYIDLAYHYLRYVELRFSKNCGQYKI